jgi:hypothetical protein
MRISSSPLSPSLDDQDIEGPVLEDTLGDAAEQGVLHRSGAA